MPGSAGGTGNGGQTSGGGVGGAGGTNGKVVVAVYPFTGLATNSIFSVFFL